MTCPTCGREELLKYQAAWIRKKNNLGCRPCGQRLRVDANPGLIREGHVSWNTGLIGFGKWPKWYPKGELNPAWAGGKTAEGTRIRNSKAYQEWRTAVFQRDAFTCVLCGQVGGQLQADHIKAFAKFPELRLEISNGRTLCIPCHEKTPNFRGRSS